ncbi:hypothetical protein PDJAM_G00051500 [Pangasius djambal]|uniref:Uncharacterized protein n=1 Tax=Pangasius djambal TaxID=1691987 RepID=A0ACC5YW35_9TELE|nr:hypothetical protein [Pangasius djambal]
MQRRRVRRQRVLRHGVGVHVHAQREVLRDLGVVGQVAYPVIRHGRAVAAHGARDAPRPLLAQVQRVQALLAERVQALEDLGRAPVQVEVVIADLTLVLLILVRAAGNPCIRLYIRLLGHGGGGGGGVSRTFRSHHLILRRSRGMTLMCSAPAPFIILY